MKDKRISEQEGGLNINLDDTDKALSFGDARYILNCWSGRSKKGNVGAIENEKGNVLVELDDLPEGVNTVIGTAKDSKNNAIFYFLHNDTSLHGIYRYNIDLNTITKVLHKQSVLNFAIDRRKGYINFANFIDDKLYWVDGVNEARKINVEKAIKFTDGLPGGYTVLDEQTITAVKAPPTQDPGTVHYSDYSRTTNFIRGKIVQFTYRYLYDDFEKSVFAPISRSSVPEFDTYHGDAFYKNLDENMYSGQYSNLNDWPFSSQAGAYNSIQLTVKVGHYTVDKIEIAFKDSELGLWQSAGFIDNQELLKTLNPGNDYDDFLFYNDRDGSVISDEEILKSQDFFPINPSTQEYLYKNVLVYGDYEDGYDPEPLDVSAEVVYEPYQSIDWFFENSFNGVLQIGDFNRNFKALVPNIGNPSTTPSFTPDKTFNVPTGVVEGDLIIFMASVNVQIITGQSKTFDSPVSIYRVTDADIRAFPLPADDFANSIVKSLKLQGFEAEALPVFGNYEIHVNSGTFLNPISDIQIYTEGDWNEASFKQGAIHEFAIQYFDPYGRRTAAQKDHNWSVYVPSWGETFAADPTLDQEEFNALKYKIKLSINHQPPAFATHYQIVYSGAINFSDFIQFWADMVDERVNISIEKGWTDWQDDEEPQANKSYTFEVGDRVRQIHLEPENVQTIPGLSGKDQDVTIKLPKTFDINESSSITKFDETDLKETTSASLNFRTRSLIEQYKEQREALEQIFNEFGHVYPISNPGTADRQHTANEQNQTVFGPAIVRLDRGDVWVRTRFYEFFFYRRDIPWSLSNAGGNNYFQYSEWRPPVIEDPDYSDYFTSSGFGFGRKIGEDPDYRRTSEINSFRNTGSYLEGSKKNDLNSIDFNAVFSVNIQFGAIRAMIEVGFTLKVIQERKVNSVYIGRRTTTNPDGTQDLILLDALVGSINPSPFEHGTTFPESVQKHDRHLYFFSDNFGKIIRDSANGQEVISDLKATKLFRELSDYILSKTDGHVFCNGAWNDEMNAYVFGFRDVAEGIPQDVMDIPEGGSLVEIGLESSEDQSFTISFQEVTNRWKSFHSYIPERMGWLGKEFITFVDGELWKHNVNNLRGNFYGQQQSMVIEPGFNINPDKIKAVKAIGVHSNKRPTLAEVFVIPNENYPEGMHTRMLAVNFELREGVFYADVKKDLNTPSLSDQSAISRLANGREIRGATYTVRLTFTETEEVVVSRVIAIYDDSELSD